MATGRTSQPTDERIDGLGSLPPGVIPTPRTAVDPQPLPEPPSRRRKLLFIAVPAVVATGIGVAIVGLTDPGAPVGDPLPGTASVQRSPADLGFVKIVRQQPGFAGVTDDALIAIGHTVCGQLEGGTSPGEIALGSSSARYSVEDVSTAVGAAAGAYCPDQMDRVGQLQ
ncbi:MAG: DUF732 domain-containing protein [Actinomycetota bacterium]|nr:DUF732 domain-containing protein [Actinomycetota bacterium]